MTALRAHLQAGYDTFSSLASKGFLMKGVWGIADHGLISATNFTTMVLVARVVSPGEFGLYSLAYTGLLFSNSLQSALIVQPHTNLGAPRSGDDYIRYTTDTGWLQVGFSILTALVVLAIAALASTFGWWVAPILLALVPAAAAWQLQDFVRRAMYTRSMVSDAFLNDLVSYGGQFALIVALWQFGHLTPVTAILALAGSSALAFMLGLWQIRSQLDWTFSRSRLNETFKANWNFGKWLLGGNVAYWTSGNVYPILAAGLVSVTATGVMRAAYTIVGPTNVVISSLDTLCSPVAARTYAQEGVSALRRLISRLQVMILLVVGSYCIAVAIFARPIFHHVYGPAYSQYSWVLVLISLTTLASLLRAPVKIGLKALGQTNAIFRIYLASSVANLTLGILAVYALGFEGVAVGLVLNAAVLQGMIWRYQRRFMQVAPLPQRSTVRAASTISEQGQA